MMNICTWNSQGYKFKDNVINDLIKKNDVDILCLQECGVLSNIHFDNYKNIKVGQWNCDQNTSFAVLYYEWGHHYNTSRCNMAILVKNTIKVCDAICLEVIGGEQPNYKDEEPTEEDAGKHFTRKGIRGMLHTKIELNGMNYRIANVHLPSGNPKFARKIGYTFLSMYFMKSENVIMVGDFNTSPETWEFKDNIHKLVTANNAYTYPSLEKDLDYMVTTMVPSSIHANVVSAPSSDHLPVVFFVP